MNSDESGKLQETSRKYLSDIQHSYSIQIQICEAKLGLGEPHFSDAQGQMFHDRHAVGA